MIRKMMVVLLVAEVAHADPCGDDGASSTSASSDSASESASEPACVDAIDVVGYRKCKKFGAWSDNLRLPHLTVELGLGTRRLAPTFAEHAGTITHGTESFAYRVVEPAATTAHDTANVLALRVTAALAAGLYAGVEGEAGVLAEARGEVEMIGSGMLGTPTMTVERPKVFGGLGVLGYGVRLGRASVAVEAAAGARFVTRAYTSSYLACETTTDVVARRGVVEARARVELWATPFVTLGATVGTSALERGMVVGGAYVGLHSRAFGGGR